MRFKRKYLIGAAIGIFMFITDLSVFAGTKLFVPLFIASLIVATGQIWVDFFTESRKQKEIETRFLDFVRNLAGAIKSGMPVSKSIIHVSKTDYGALSPYVLKLGYQVEWAIPVHKALLFFSNSTKNDIIRRSVATVIEAEQSGGNMEDVLESITSSLIEIKKIKEQRRASIHSQVIQSYVIFFIFIGVMIVVQNMLVPYLVGAGEGEEGGLFGGIGGGGGSLSGGISSQTRPSLVMDVEIRLDSFRNFAITLSRWFSSMRGVFVMLSLIQGFFAGVIIGKMAEGDITSGLKHSLILMTVAFLVMSFFKPGF
ncbi:type II secretion system F family protein [archaeon]|jgi:archaeal flagellar protein FlaJ|nr:type II secretion system F family protein [archaeon]MBT4022098.1 type II secretion system F family protein [archaeon]MBT4272711.1 type II secretion system F family protein [archaeon]MBT4461510.1 type II secretion system F family protein [archaeon]MBT4857721.1 type II secretion system F family protein [archaeon]